MFGPEDDEGYEDLEAIAQQIQLERDANDWLAEHEPDTPTSRT
jgi:hypothetical protein